MGKSLAQLLKAQAEQKLHYFQSIVRNFEKQYGMTADQFYQSRIHNKRHSWEHEETYFDWKTAEQQVEEMKQQIAKLEEWLSGAISSRGIPNNLTQNQEAKMRKGWLSRMGGWMTLLLLGVACAGLTTTGYRYVLTPALLPEEEQGPYRVEEDGTVVYDAKDFKIEVKPMSDEKLNRMFPEVSYKKDLSTNPYTYGDWIDPELGYTPTRFTVFLVKVYNYARPKINLNPWKAILVSDRGDRLHSYGRDDADRAVHNFYAYYEARKGASGPERDRFEERMGLVRQTLYIDGPLFKGDKKEGFLVFDPLDPSVREAELILKDFVLEYDVTDWPSKTIDISFKFKKLSGQIKPEKK